MSWMAALVAAAVFALMQWVSVKNFSPQPFSSSSYRLKQFFCRKRGDLGVDRILAVAATALS